MTAIVRRALGIIREAKAVDQVLHVGAELTLAAGEQLSILDHPPLHQWQYDGMDWHGTVFAGLRFHTTEKVFFFQIHFQTDVLGDPPP